jgi:4-hydroxybenzoate polyprenyltransferase
MLPALLQTMRPKQWMKNLVIFAALVFDLQIRNTPAVLRTLAGFALLCALSSTVYLFNDLADIDRDRLHPKKRLRPLPSGRLKPGVALAAAIVLPLAALPVSLALSWKFGVIALLYLTSNVFYSFRLKNVVIIDVMLVALGYVLRVGAGVALITVERFSPWLYLCMTLLALFMALGKRRGELILMSGNNNDGASRRVLRDYTLGYLDELIGLVSTATVMAYSLYTFSAPNLPPNHAMMLTIPFVIYGIFRYLWLIHIKGEGGAPDELVLTDRPLQATFLLWGLSAVAVLYLSQ